MGLSAAAVDLQRPPPRPKKNPLEAVIDVSDGSEENLRTEICCPKMRGSFPFV